MNILIQNAMIVTMDPLMDIIKEGYVLIEDETISMTAEGKYPGNMEGMKIIDGRGYCILPGLINCHTHMAMTLLRGYGEGLPLMKWLNEKIWPMEAKFGEKHIKTGTELALVEMLRSGTTTVSDMYFYQETVKECTEKYNMRAMLGFPIMGEAWESQLDGYIKSVEKINSGKSLMCRSMLAPHSPYTLDSEALSHIASAAKDCGCGIHIHVSETEDERKIVKEKYNSTSCELLLKTGIFDVPALAAHCVYLSGSDMDIIKSKNVSPVYNPQSNMKLASGAARINDMLKREINVCIGTDGASSNNNLNMFEEMQTGALLQKLISKDATVLGGKDMLKMATANGAAALGFENLGMIKPGFLADIIMVNLNKPTMVPLHDIYSNLVFSASGSEVEYVIINGDIVMEKGEFTKIDEEKVIFESGKLAKEIAQTI